MSADCGHPDFHEAESIAAAQAPSWSSWSSRFAATAGLSIVATALTWFVGAFAGSSMSSEESCRQAGVTYDSAYRAVHWRESSRWFPLHDRCNATYDLVPAWINPALVLLSLLAVLCIGAAVWLAVVRHRTTSARRRPHGNGPE